MITLLAIASILALSYRRKPIGISGRLFGGNSGYDGYSMSVRARQAREDGRFPKTAFKREYGINDATLDVLLDLGIIANNEWHHTSKFGNKTKFYYWLDDSDFDDIYNPNRDKIRKLVKNGEYSEIADMFNCQYNDYGTGDIRIGDILETTTVGGSIISEEVVGVSPGYIHLRRIERLGDSDFEFINKVGRFTISRLYRKI